MFKIKVLSPAFCFSNYKLNDRQIQKNVVSGFAKV